MCCVTIFCQVEALELQVKDAASLQNDFDLKKEELEMELKAAVDKVLQSNIFMALIRVTVFTKRQFWTD
jgi:hypothetical protein